MNKNLTIKNLPNKFFANSTIFYGFAASPFGTALIFIYEKNIISLGFTDNKNGFADNKNKIFAEMKKRFAGAKYIENKKLARQYIKKIFINNNKLSLALVGTEFQLKVWRALLTVPVGTTRTYSFIANKIKKPLAVRAVATTIGNNPIAYLIPCHRIIGKNGALCGYHWGLARKEKMLQREGAL